MLWIVLPAIFIVFSFFWYYSDCRNLFGSAGRIRQSILLALLTGSAWISITSEVLSLFKAIHLPAMIAVWLIPNILLIWLLRSRLKGVKLNVPAIPLKRLDQAFLLILAAQLLFLALLALITPPNNWDSMTYHMSRVMHWIQNQSLANYPTHVIRQLFNAPLAELAILHAQLLSGSDLFAQVVQYISMLGSLVAVSLIAQHVWPIIPVAQWYAVVFAATLPIGLYEAVSTQNDYVLTFFIAGTVYYLLRFFQSNTWPLIFVAGACAGLAVQTKATAAIFLLPLAGWYLIRMVAAKKIRWVTGGLVAVLVALTFNLGYFGRNIELYGEPFGLQEGKVFGTTNQRIGIATSYSNLIKNVAFNFQANDATINTASLNIAAGLHRLFDLDLNDPKTSAGPFFVNSGVHLYSEDYAPNPFHTLLLLITFLLSYLFKEDLPSLLKQYIWFLIGVILVFVSWLMWQHFITRLQLPVFIVAAPWVGGLLGYVAGKGKVAKLLVYACIGVCLWVSAEKIYNNYNKPLHGTRTIWNTSRKELYFIRRPEMLANYQQVAEQVRQKKYGTIALEIGHDDWEYPLWVYLRDAVSAIRIKHIHIKNNVSATKEKPFTYDALLKKNKEGEILILEP